MVSHEILLKQMFECAFSKGELMTVLLKVVVFKADCISLDVGSLIPSQAFKWMMTMMRTLQVANGSSVARFVGSFPARFPPFRLC